MAQPPIFIGQSTHPATAIAAEVRRENATSRDISTRLCESSDESLGNWVTLQIDGNHWDRASRTLRRPHCRWTARVDNVNLQLDQVARDIR